MESSSTQDFNCDCDCEQPCHYATNIFDNIGGRYASVEYLLDILVTNISDIPFQEKLRLNDDDSYSLIYGARYVAHAVLRLLAPGGDSIHTKPVKGQLDIGKYTTLKTSPESL